ncbi:sodium channel and clathrin linker 1 [Discoglossus pictus]
MTTLEIEYLRDQVQRLSAALKQYEDQSLSRQSVERGDGVPKDDYSAAIHSTEKRNMNLLIGEFDKHTEEMSEQLHFYQIEMGEMRLKLENIIKENERLHEQLKESLEKQLDLFPTGSGLANDGFTEQELIKNLQEQLQLANQEKEHALELWQTVAQEMDRLQQLYQQHMTQAHMHVAERQKQKEQLANLQQVTKQLHGAHEKVERTNQQFLQTVNEQHMEIEQLRKQLKQAKLDLRVATIKVEEMTKVTENIQEEMHRKEEDVLAVQGREDASEKRVQQLQSALTQLETRLRVTVQDLEQLKIERTALEKHIGELQSKCAELEEEKYGAIIRVRDSIQLLEEANLQKDQALLRERQKEEEIENMKEAITKLIQEAAARTRKEVENAKKLFNNQISLLTQDISSLQMDCGDKQSQIDRALREKRAAEEELQKVYREGLVNEGDYRKLDVLHQRCLIAERTKDDLQISLQAAQNKIRQLELNSEEELSRCYETIQKLNNTLDSDREACTSVSEERLKLSQENEQLRKNGEEWRRTAMESQQKAKFQISTMAHEFSVKEQGFEVQLQEMENSHRNSISELRKMLNAQQKAAKQWKEETKKLTEDTESRLESLRSDLNRKKHQNQQLLSQVETAQERNFELEKLVADYQEKASRLQKRLDKAEERATSATKQLSLITSQRRKANMMDNENV